jgi:hypothetical protein
MNTEKLRVIIDNLESILECLKSEINSDETVYEPSIRLPVQLDDYDEVFYDDED